MSKGYPGDREIEQLHSQADNVPASGTGTITIRDVEEVMAAANDQVLIDRQELADLRRQLAEAQQVCKYAEESQQVVGMLWREQQTRAEKAEKALAEVQAEIAVAHKRIDAQFFDDDGHRLPLSERIDGIVKLAIGWRRKALVAEQQLSDCETQRKQAEAQCAAMRQALEKWRDVRAICRTCKEHDCEEACEDVELRVNEARVATEAILATATGKALLAEVERLREALQQRGGEG